MAAIDPEDRWLPPHPHRERLLEILAMGRAHIEEQGHGLPPLLIYEDGGAMELPRFRWIDGEAVAEGGSEPGRQTTQYLDVCGSIDEFKRILRENPEAAARDPVALQQLLDDALYMIDRMVRRLQQYQEFKEKVRAQLSHMDQFTGPDTSPAFTSARELKQFFTVHPDEAVRELESLNARAEQIRNVASALEKCLYPLRDASITIHALYEEVRGARQWKNKGT